jgi:hypothetical protein
MEKLDFIILYIIVMMVFCITASVFYPDQYSFGEEDYAGFDASQYEDQQHQEEKGWWEGFLDALGGVWDGLVGVATFLWACLSFNIPFVPVIVRLFLTIPFHIGMMYVIATYIRGGG